MVTYHNHKRRKLEQQHRAHERTPSLFACYNGCVGFGPSVAQAALPEPQRV